MAGSSNQFTYGLSPTLITVAPGATATAVRPPNSSNGCFIKYVSGGSLAIVPGIGSSGTALGIPILAAEPPFNIDGPATFFLNSGGATAIAGVIFKMSSGWSLLP